MEVTTLKGIIDSLKQFQSYSNQIKQGANSAKDGIKQAQDLIAQIMTMLNKVDNDIFTPASTYVIIFI